MPTESPPRTRHSTLLRRGLYASGNFAKNIVWGASELALLFVFTDLAGFDPAVSGALILASLIFDALLDPWVGAFADRLGRFCPLAWAGAPALGLSFIALFAGPAIGHTGIAFAAATLFALRAAYSLVDIPHNALIARIAVAPEDRTALSGVRFLFSAAATFVLGATLPPLLAIEPADAAGDALALWALAFGALATFVLMIAAWAASPWDTPAPERNTLNLLDVAASILAPLRAPEVRLLLALACLGNALTPSVAKTILYFADKVLDDATAASGAIMALSIGQIVGIPLWIWVARKTGAARALVLAHVVAGVCALPLLFGSSLTAPPFILATGLHGLGASGVYTLIWTLAASASDARETAAGKSSSGAVFGLTILVMQISSGIGSSLIGAMLAFADYNPDASPTPATRAAIASFALGPAVAALAVATLLWRRALTTFR